MSQDESAEGWELETLDLPNTTEKLRVAYEIPCRRARAEERNTHLIKRKWA